MQEISTDIAIRDNVPTEMMPPALMFLPTFSYFVNPGFNLFHIYQIKEKTTEQKSCLY
jgi:hypothetical protein